MPSLAGKTTYSQTFEDIEAGTAPGVPGQTTRYTLNIKAPAGVKLDDITSMQYDWNTENGKIAINKSAQTDTTQQAASIVQAQQQQLEFGSKFLEALTSIANLAAPLVGQHMQIQGTNEAAAMAAKIDALTKILQAQQAAKPTTTAAPATAPARLPSAPPPLTPLNDGTLPVETNIAPTH